MAYFLKYLYAVLNRSLVMVEAGVLLALVFIAAGIILPFVWLEAAAIHIGYSHNDVN